jgi:hypothetical protein
MGTVFILLAADSFRERKVLRTMIIIVNIYSSSLRWASLGSSQVTL